MQEARYRNGQRPDRVSKQNTEPGMVVQDSNQSLGDGSRNMGSLRITTKQAFGQLGPPVSNTNKTNNVRR